ncbi:helix-turn-helix transcriptional regulator [Streptomyces sp. NBC_00328]|uniref:helix-turn-helix transcriptional regulator n=1 Tax=Streptomyces sp. NBC_00328 TaxID=2903646 RepID=UPI002E2D9DD9|nr:helix-turn-helix transcriptional regulator [Streptomyces sp. NBC_00328]
MVNNRHPAGQAAPGTICAAPAGPPAGLEVISLAALRARTRADGTDLGVPQRPAFHQVLTLASGTLRQSVDFTAHDVERGTWLWTRPGQVLQWGDLTGAEGTLIAFERDFPGAATVRAARLDDPHARVLCTPEGEVATSLRVATEHLVHEFRAPGRLPRDARGTVLRHLLDVLILYLARPEESDPPPTGPGETFLRFRATVERDFARTRRVDDYALALGYSARTLSRAALESAGIGAKEFIDRRVILEAKRLLAHTDLAAARIAAQLGFSSATNFAKYFHQRAGQAPIAFRTAVRGRGAGIPSARGGGDAAAVDACQGPSDASPGCPGGAP